MAAIKAGIIISTTKAELERAEADRNRAQALLADAKSAPEQFATVLHRAAEHYRALDANLHKTLQRDVQHPANALRRWWGAVKLLPNVAAFCKPICAIAEGLISLAVGKSLNIEAVAGATIDAILNPEITVSLLYPELRMRLRKQKPPYPN